MSDPDHAIDDFGYEDNDCPNCGGEGYVFDCFEEYACIDPEGGCDLCMRRCDWCNPRKPPKTADDNGVAALRQVLADALDKAGVK